MNPTANSVVRRDGRLGERVLILLAVVWAIAVAIGLFLLFQYQTTAGVTGDPATYWPAGSRVGPARDHARLVMAVHPQCPCSRASIEALARIMAQTQDRATASVLFLKPAGVPQGWEQSDLWHSAAAIPGVRVLCDDEGREAARFGVQSSGHVLLYDGNGRRIFSGGITAGRGHNGDNAGLDQCLALINGTAADQRDTPVYGCSLLGLAVRPGEGVAQCSQTN